jgi:hypothetical protein
MRPRMLPVAFAGSRPVERPWLVAALNITAVRRQDVAEDREGQPARAATTATAELRRALIPMSPSDEVIWDCREPDHA